MGSTYYVYTASFAPASRRDDKERTTYIVTMHRARELSARSGAAALAEAKKLGFHAPMVGL